MFMFLFPYFRKNFLLIVLINAANTFKHNYNKGVNMERQCNVSKILFIIVIYF